MSKVLELVKFMQEVDAAVQEYHKDKPITPTYVVAGGALRDTLLGQPVKDIDIVIVYRDDWGDLIWPDEEYGPTGGFAATDAPFRVRDLPVQLIWRDGDVSIQNMMAYHSLGVSNVFWKDGALTFDPLWFKDVADKQHTVNKSRWGGVGDKVSEERLQKYITRIRDKYPWPIREE